MTFCRGFIVLAFACRPQEIDEAARRRFVKRLYVPLPEREARKQIMLLLMSTQSHALNPQNFDDICDQTDGKFIKLVSLSWV